MTLVYGAGGPYADLADMHSGLHERDRAFSCDEFVDHVVELASRATTAHPSARARRRFVAEALLDRYVRRIRVLGVDVRTVIAGRAAPAGAQADAVPPGVEVAGFKRTLVAGGQGGEALSHLAAAAAAVLLGKPYLVWLASAFDWLQGFVRRDRAQARAEIAGNRCGERLGTELGRSMLEPESGDALRSRLLRCVCADREARSAMPTVSSAQRPGHATGSVHGGQHASAIATVECSSILPRTIVPAVVKPGAAASGNA